MNATIDKLYDFSEDPILRVYKVQKIEFSAIKMVEKKKVTKKPYVRSLSEEVDEDYSVEEESERSQSNSSETSRNTTTPEEFDKSSGNGIGEDEGFGVADRPKKSSMRNIESPPSSSSSKTAWLKGVDKEYGAEVMRTIIDDTRTRLSEIEGNWAAKQALEECVVLPSLNPKLFTGLRAPCRGILLFGPPGNGKTMLAKAVANECNSTFFNISAATIMSKWIGEAEKLVKSLFQVARNAQPSIIFIDEIDSMLCKRTESEDGSERRVKTEFLIQLDGCSTGKSTDDRVLVLGATNRPHELDEGILRRFPQRIFIDLPDQAARANMIKRTFELHKTEIRMSDEEFDEIAAQTSNYSYSDLMALCRAAALIPIRCMSKNELKRCSASQLRPVMLADMLNAARAVRSSVSDDNRHRLLEFAQNHAQMS